MPAGDGGQGCIWRQGQRGIWVPAVSDVEQQPQSGRGCGRRRPAPSRTALARMAEGK